MDGSVTVNGVSQPTYDLVQGFTLPDIDCGESVIITYQIIADNPLTIKPITNNANIEYSVVDPIAGTKTVNEDSNLITLPVVSSNLSITKAVDKSFAIQGDTLHYTSTVTNSGNTDKTNLFFKDSIPTGTTFVVGSVKVNSVAQSTYNPEDGFNIPDLGVGESAVIEFDVTVN